MKQVRFHEHGGPEVLRVEDVPEPQPDAGQVRLKVEAAGVNFADLMRRSGFYVEPSPLPYVLGMEAAGTIEAVGPGVDGLRAGTPALAIIAGGGGYSQYVVAAADQIVPLPSGLGAAEATALVVQGLTAELILAEVAPLKGGEAVLVNAAAGGVGTLAVQIAKLRGAGLVIATASTPEKRELARSLGADVTIDYTLADWPRQLLDATGGRHVDVILETVGGEVFGQSLEVLAPFGRLVGYGASSGMAATLETLRLLGPNHTVSGFYLGGFFGRGRLIPEAMARLFSWVGQGVLRIPDATSFPLEHAADAHRAIHARRTTGKVVLRPWA